MSTRPAAVEDSSWKRWVVGARGFAVMVAVGSMYGMSAVLSAVPGPPAQHPGTAHAAAFVVTSAGLALGSPLSGRMLVRYQARLVALAGAVLWAAANVLAGIGLVLDVPALTLACASSVA